MRFIMALAAKDLRLLFRDKTGAFFTLLFPLLYSIFFGLFMSGGSSSAIKIAVVDDDRTDGSRAFVDKLEKAAELRIVRPKRDAGAAWPMERAAELVRRGKVTAYVRLAAGFGESRRNPFRGGADVSGGVELGIDPSESAESGMLQGVLTKYLYEDISDLFSNPGRMNRYVDDSLKALENSSDADPLTRGALRAFLPALKTFMTMMPTTSQDTDDGGGAGGAGFQPVSLHVVEVARPRSGPKNPFEISFPQGALWGILGCVTGFAASLVMERNAGTLIRLRAAPILPRHILLGKALACVIATLVVLTAASFVGAVAFGVRPSSLTMMIAAMLSTSIGFSGLMMLLAVLGKTERAAAGIGWAILMVCAMIGGGMIPLFIMPPWLQELSNVSPVKWAIYALEGAIWRGLTPTEMLTPCLLLIGMGIACFAIGARAFRWAS